MQEDINQCFSMVPLDPKFASDFGPSMSPKHAVRAGQTWQPMCTHLMLPSKPTLWQPKAPLHPLDFKHLFCPALNNVTLVLGCLCNQSPWSLQVGTVVAVLPEKPTLHENFC